MYADDTTINFNLKDFDSICIEADITNELEKVNIWLKLNKLSLNTQRTKLMVFHRKKKNVRGISLSIDHNQIEQIPVFNFLCIIFNENLSWKTHTKMIANKISRVTGILYRLKSVFPKEVLVTLYKTLIASYIHYGLLVWGMSCNRMISPNRMRSPKKAIRVITNSSYLAHTTPLFKEEKLLKVQDISTLRLLKFYYKLCSGLLPPYFNRCYEIIEMNVYCVNMSYTNQ